MHSYDAIIIGSGIGGSGVSDVGKYRIGTGLAASSALEVFGLLSM